MDFNPYQSPTCLTEQKLVSANERILEAGSVAAWERLRVIYNGVLAGVVLLTTLLEPGQFLSLDFWGCAIAGAIAANLCFCVGITLEYYLTLLGADRRWSRAVLFVIGTLFSMLLTFAMTLLSINAFQLQA